MKKFISLILTAVLALTIGVMATGCKDTKSVTIGYTLYAPMNYEDANGVLVGFDTELAQKAFGDLGYKVRFKLIDWGNKYTELNGGTVDCLWNGFTANCADDDGIQRSEKVDFTYNYMTNAQCVIRKTSAAELTNSSELSGKTVAFEAGSAGDGYVSGISGVVERSVTSQMDAVLQVKSGNCDYAVIDILLAQSILGKGDYSDVIINTGISIDAEYYAIGFKKGSEFTALINQKLVEYAESGYLAQLAEKYGLSTQVITDFSSQITQ